MELTVVHSHNLLNETVEKRMTAPSKIWDTYGCCHSDPNNSLRDQLKRMTVVQLHSVRQSRHISTDVMADLLEEFQKELKVSERLGRKVFIYMLFSIALFPVTVGCFFS